MNRLMTGLLMSVVFLFSAALARATEIECAFKASRILLKHGSPNASDFIEPLTGELLHAYNRANLSCARGAVERLVTERSPVVCAGVWDIGFSRSGQQIDVIAQVLLTNADGKVSAHFTKNWDARDNHHPEKVSVPCVVR